MKNKGLFLLLLFSCSCIANAQEYRLKGVIIPILIDYSFSARIGIEYIQKNKFGYSIEYTYTTIRGGESKNTIDLNRADLLLHKYTGKKTLDRSFFVGLGLHYRVRKSHYEPGTMDPSIYSNIYHATGLRLLMGKRIHIFKNLGLEISESIGIENGFIRNEDPYSLEKENHHKIAPVFRFNLLFSYRL